LLGLICVGLLSIDYSLRQKRIRLRPEDGGQVWRK
jgi:hypothetical protein